ncbi:MAG: hypothetical protein J5537_07790 [Lachnospiraceae bacterium]|nr:hypothetical protein [Lachnospiraceae bacterium]
MGKIINNLFQKMGKDGIELFEAIDFWRAMGISETITARRFGELLGGKECKYRDINKAMGYLSSVVDTIQEKMVADIEIQGSKIFAGEVYQILDKCYNYYIREKKTREKLVNKNVLCNEILEKYGHNRNIAMSIIAACNIWIENSILFQSKIDREIEEKLQDIDPVLMVDLYVYGAASTALSTLSLSKNIPGYALYYGVDINLKLSEPISLCRDHPIIYYNPLLAGNQHAFSIKGDDYKNANMSAFGKGFIEEYKIPFVESLRVLSSLQEYELNKGRFSCIQMSKEEFEKSIDYYKQDVIDCRDFWNTFVLTKEKIEKNRQNDEQIIWKMSVNKERHELRPIICFDDNTVFVSYPAFPRYITMLLQEAV